MILKLIDNTIRKSFSDSAFQYEALSGLQKEIGRELVQKIQDIGDCDRILDVGMGTGRLTNRLKFYFPEARVIGIDFAPGMIDLARKKYDSFSIVQADGAGLPFKAGLFNVIISNLVYQWMDDLLTAFRDAHRTLKHRGRFCFTMFGQNTLNELFHSFENTAPAVTMKRRPAKQDIICALQQAGFKNVITDEEVIKVHFDDMIALMKWLKDIGANRISRDIYIGKDRIKKANKFYQQHFCDAWGVQASFEVIWAQAEKIN